MNNKSILAFTLAEVLIALTIIGVVAAVTIPTLMQTQEKQSTVTKFQKAYSVLSNAVEMSEIDNGTMDTWVFPTSDSATQNKEFAKTYLVPYLNISKTCDNNPSDCYPERFYYLNGTSIGSGTTRYFLTLTDGTALRIYWNLPELVNIEIDLNGINPPNRYGRDIFVFGISRRACCPKGFNNCYTEATRENIAKSGGPCASDKTGVGSGCGALIMKDGWKIADDYPW